MSDWNWDTSVHDVEVGKAASDNTAVPHSPVPGLVFVFSSRACLWPGMAHELYHEEPAFRDVIQRCEREVQRQLGWSLEELLRQPADRCRLDESEEHLEPALTAVQIGLSQIWRGAGVRPDAVIGLCGGEFAAAYVAGVLNFEQAVDLACRVSRVIRQKLGYGRMEWVDDVDPGEAEALRRTAPVPIYIASKFSGQTIFSCACDAYDAFLAYLDSRGLTHRRMPTDFAFHSPITDTWKAEFMRPFQQGTTPGYVPIYSVHTGGRVDQDVFAAGDMRYWWRAVRDPVVHLDRVVENLVHDGYGTFLEINADITFSKRIEDAASRLGKTVVTLPSMLRDQPVIPVIDQSRQALTHLGHRISSTRTLADRNV